MATAKTIETEVELLKREVADMKGIHIRLDSAIEKIADVSSKLHTIMAVHEEKLIRQEEDLESQEKIKALFKSKVDVVVSDMAVNTTGIKDIDAIYTGELAMEAMNFSKEMLVKEGRFVSKIFLGSSFNEIVALG